MREITNMLGMHTLHMSSGSHTIFHWGWGGVGKGEVGKYESINTAICGGMPPRKFKTSMTTFKTHFGQFGSKT